MYVVVTERNSRSAILLEDGNCKETAQLPVKRLNARIVPRDPPACMSLAGPHENSRNLVFGAIDMYCQCRSPQQV